MPSSQSQLPTERTPPSCPVSCVGPWDTIVGFIAIFTVAAGAALHAGAIAISVLVTMGLFTTLAIVEMQRAPWRHKARSVEPISLVIENSCIKSIGCLASIFFLGFIYWLFPEFDGEIYRSFFVVVTRLGPYILPWIIAYFFFTEWRCGMSQDGLSSTGNFLIGRWKNVDIDLLKQNLLEWMMRGFFLPIMFGDLVNGVATLQAAYRHSDLLSTGSAFSVLFECCIVIELVFVVAGYSFPSRLLDTHVRQVDATWSAWVATLVCYGPFLSFFFVHYFAYQSDRDWQTWLAPHPILRLWWGIVIILLYFIHLCSDCIFGLRFSNLTNRGIVTNGLYRFCKHPAYLSKNVRWWLVAVPFAVETGCMERVRLCILLVAVNIIYVFRSYVEERLLSNDPIYVNYALWIEDHGVLRRLGLIFPFLLFSRRLRCWGRISDAGASGS